MLTSGYLAGGCAAGKLQDHCHTGAESVLTHLNTKEALWCQYGHTYHIRTLLQSLSSEHVVLVVSLLNLSSFDALNSLETFKLANLSRFSLLMSFRADSDDDERFLFQ